MCRLMTKILTHDVSRITWAVTFTSLDFSPFTGFILPQIQPEAAEVRLSLGEEV